MDGEYFSTRVLFSQDSLGHPPMFRLPDTMASVHTEMIHWQGGDVASVIVVGEL